MTTNDNAMNQAVAQLASVRQMVAALGVDWDRLGTLRFDRSFGSEHGATIEQWADANPDDATELAELEAAAGEHESEDDARQAIDEDPLCVEVRSGWHAIGENGEDEEYRILLCTGGPAVRIIGELESGEPTTARIEYQDWGTGWTEYRTDSDEEADMVKYAACFCFGE